ncbi:MAG: molybdopterin molybdotransferase MoeA [Ruminococcus sp.]|nr:molybdopterin molybdotransferase MoeA [Ruminococcus sp.]
MIERHNKRWPSKKEVLDKLFLEWKPEITIESIAVEKALGRVAAEDVCSCHNIPVVRASSMDGIAVRFKDFEAGNPDTENWIYGQDYVRADTGDDFDDRFDTVIAIEGVTLLSEGGILISENVEVKKGMNIRPCGSMLKEGDLLVKQWTKLTPSDLSALVMGGVTEIKVTKKPTVAFLPTGSELVAPGTKLTRGKNIDSNSILVKKMLHEMGADPICYPIVEDDPEKLEKELDNALEWSDVVIINGGSSKGGEDFNADLLKKKGTVICHNVSAAPGRPICIAVIDNKPVINVPGPAIACFYSMDWCVREVVNRLLCQKKRTRKTITLELSEDITYHPGMEILCKMEIHKTEDGYVGRQTPFRASTVVENLTAPGVFITDPGLGCHPKGSKVEVELLREEEEL